MTHMEIEVKFLIEKPNFDNLAKLYGPLDKYHITQVYLVSPNDSVERRIHRKVHLQTGNIEYTYTTKGNILGESNLKVREEIEEKISYTQYKNYFDTARDLNYAIIDKERTVFFYEGITIEIDEYPQWSDLAILEIELKDDKQTFNIPGEISLISNVTNNKEYKNKTLAKIFAFRNAQV